MAFHGSSVGNSGLKMTGFGERENGQQPRSGNVDPQRDQQRRCAASEGAARERLKARRRALILLERGEVAFFNRHVYLYPCVETTA